MNAGKAIYRFILAAYWRLPETGEVYPEMPKWKAPGGDCRPLSLGDSLSWSRVEPWFQDQAKSLKALGLKPDKTSMAFETTEQENQQPIGEAGAPFALEGAPLVVSKGGVRPPSSEVLSRFRLQGESASAGSPQGARRAKPLARIDLQSRRDPGGSPQETRFLLMRLRADF